MAKHIDCVIFLSKGKLAFYERSGLLEENAIPTEMDIDQHLTISDFILGKIDTFFRKLNRKNLKVALVFGNSFVFEKYAEIETGTGVNIIVENYLNELPISKQDSCVIRLKSKDKLRMMVMDWRPVDEISEKLSEYGEIQYVTTSDAMIDQNLDVKEVFSIVENKGNINWLARGDRFNKAAEDNNSNRQIYKKILTLTGVALGMAAIVVAGYFGYMKVLEGNESQKKTENETVATVTPTSTIEPTPTITYLKFEEMRVEILNGSGISGQAKRLSQMLEPLGITEFTTGNATNVPDVTTMTISSRVSEDDIEKIKNILEEEFDSIEIQKRDSDQADIVIVTSK